MARTRGILSAFLAIAGFLAAVGAPMPAHSATLGTCTTTATSCTVDVQLTNLPYSLIRMTYSVQGFRGDTDAYIKLPSSGMRCMGLESSSASCDPRNSFKSWTEDGSETTDATYVPPGMIKFILLKKQVCDSGPTGLGVLPNCYGNPAQGGDWSGTITLDVEGTGEVPIAACAGHVVDTNTQGSCVYSFTTTSTTTAVLRIVDDFTLNFSAVVAPGSTGSCIADGGGACRLAHSYESIGSGLIGNSPPQTVNITLGPGTYGLHVNGSMGQGSFAADVILR